jgi:hypothetical protein
LTYTKNFRNKICDHSKALAYIRTPDTDTSHVSTNYNLTKRKWLNMIIYVGVWGRKVKVRRNKEVEGSNFTLSIILTITNNTITNMLV